MPLSPNDMLIGTSTAKVGGKQKNITRNFSVQQIADFIGEGGTVFDPTASDFQIGVFNQGGTKLTGSIMSQDAFPGGTGITVAGNLTTTNNFTALGDVVLGNQQLTNNIKLLSETYLSGQIRDAGGNLGGTDQILISNNIGFVSWTDYKAGLVYQGVWDATTGRTTPGNILLESGVGQNGQFYIVTVAGNYQLDGNPASPESPPYWQVGDWVVFVSKGSANEWQKIDNTSVLTGTGTDNKIAMWTGGATPSVTLTDSLISQDTGATTVTVAGSLASTSDISGVNVTGTGNLSGDNLLLTGTVSLNAQLGSSGQVLTSQGTADAIWANPTPVNNITGSGTANTLSMFTGQYTVGNSVVTQSADALTVDVLTKTVTDSSAYTINTNIGKLTRTGGPFPGAGALTSNVTIGAQYTYGSVDMFGSNIELHTYNAPNNVSSPITLWSSSTSGLGVQIRTNGGSIVNVAGTYSIQATGAGAGTNPEAVQISSNTGIKFEGQGDAANINFRSYNTNLLDSGDINFISETQEGQAGNVSFSSIATDANGTAGEIRLAGAGISTSATDAVPLGLVIASNGHVKTGTVGDTYTLGSSTDGSNVKLNLDAASGTDSAVTLTGAGGLTIAQANDIVTLTAPASSDTTYALAAGVKNATSVPLNLTPSTGSGTTVNLTEGTGITLAQTSATEITISGSAQGVTSVGGTANRISVTAGNAPVVDAVTSAVSSISTSLATGAQIQTAINAAVANVGAFQGAYDAANNTPDLDVAPSAAIQNGWFWAVTVAGTFFSENVQIGDFIFANQDNPGATFANWTVIQSGQDIAGSGTTDGATVKGVAGFNSNDFDVSVNGWVEAKDFSGSTPGYVPDATSATAGTFLKEDGTWSTTGSVTGSGTANYVTKWNTGGTGIQNSTIFDDGTNVSIGTTTPIARLDVRGAANSTTASFSNSVVQAGEYSGIDIESGVAAYGSSIRNINTGSTPGYLQPRLGFFTQDTNTYLAADRTEKLSILTSGNVGIGTTTPSEKLQMSTPMAGSPTSNIFLEVDGTNVQGGGSSIVFGTSATAGTMIQYNAKITGTRSDGNGSSDLSFFTTYQPNSINSALRMIIKDSGNVGIGTASPAARLDVSSESSTMASFRATGGTSNNKRLEIGTGGDRVVLKSFTNTTNAEAEIAFSNGNSEAMRIDLNGNVGIGTDQPVVSLDLSTKNDAVSLPVGDNTARPSTPVPGMIRYNTLANEFEGYSGILNVSGSWGALGGGGASATITSNQTTTINATTTVFALGATPNGNSVNFVDVFIDGVYQETTTYSVSGQNLTFNDPVPSGVTVETKTTADYNVGAVVTTASLGQANTTGNVNLRIIPNYITSNITAQANNLYIFDSTTQAYTLTLPSSPQPGDSIKVSIRGGLATNELAVPATENIMGGVLGVGLVINNATAAFEIIWAAGSQGWVIIGNV
jgi:hypothetical protein